jgi:hypothetical protein
MAIRVERTGARTVVSQTRRGLRIAVWTIAFFALVGAAMIVREGLSPRHTVIACSRATGRCQVDHGRGAARDIPLDAIKDVVDVRDAERVSAVFERRSAGDYQLCSAPLSAPEADGIRTAIVGLAGFLADPGSPSIEVACDSRFAGDSAGAIAIRIAASLGGVALVLLMMVMFLIEIRSEIDGDTGLVRVHGRSRFPRRRWSVERATGEVSGIVTQRRGWLSNYWSVYLRFRDDSTILVLAPSTGSGQKVNRWVRELREALGLPPPPAAS